MSSQNMYFIIFGSNPSLSAAEVNWALHLTDNEVVFLGEDFLIVRKHIVSPEKLVRHLGGAVKIGEVLGESLSTDAGEDIYEVLKEQTSSERKLYIGFSYYPEKEARKKQPELFKKSLSVKKKLQADGYKVRVVRSREVNLSAVVIDKNKLLTENGYEFVYLSAGNKTYLGKTLAVQPFADFSHRDYGRPSRDDRSGMLPPKLAQVMINLVGVDNKAQLVDPFCGSGTVLQEGLLMGYKFLNGFDVSQVAVEHTLANLQWLRREYPLISGKFRVRQVDVTHLSRELPPHSIHAIVTEPDLGNPAVNKKMAVSEVSRLERLYEQAYREFALVLMPGAKVVMVWPIFFDTHYLQLERAVTKIGFKKVKPFSTSWQNAYYLNQRENLEYGRPHQKVKREITIWQKS